MDPSAHLPGLAPRAAVRSVRRTAGRPAAPTAVVLSAVATGAGAFAVDVATGEHTTHTVALVLVVATIAALGRLIAPRYRGMAPVLNAAVMVQPALHLAGTWVGGAGGQSGEGAGTWDGALHHLVSDRTTWGQVVATLLIVVAVLICGSIADLLFRFARARIRRLSRGPAPVRDVGPRPSSARRRGSMLRWCGWTLRAARRGPPRPPPLPAF